jgi:hypothetical protein
LAVREDRAYLTEDVMVKSRIVVALALAGLCVLADSRPSVAQAPRRSGFFIGFGLGAGSLGIEDASERETSASAYLKLGGALSDRVLLGGQSVAWVKEQNGATVSSSSLSVIAYVYPNPQGGFFLQGGLGLANLEIEVESSGSASDTGSAVTLGAGFDIGFGGRFGLTPYGSWILSHFDGGNTNLLHFGLGFNWY